MTKKNTLLILISIVILSTISFALISNNNKGKNTKQFFQNTIPFFDNEPKAKTTSQPSIFLPQKSSVATQTNYDHISQKIADKTSETEKDKIVSLLPFRVENFKTNTNITTTINIYTLASDPPQSVRIEIYGPNYYNIGLLSEDAKAFKSSFESLKKIFKDKNVNLNNLQIIYGNRQYIQNTATLWVKEFGLLN